MKGQDLYEALGRVDPAVLEAAAETPRQRRIWRRPAVIAACAALLLAGTAVAVFCGVEIRMLDAADPETYTSSRGTVPSGADAVFQVAGQVEDTPLEAFPTSCWRMPLPLRRTLTAATALLTPGKRLWTMWVWKCPARRGRPLWR